MSRDGYSHQYSDANCRPVDDGRETDPGVKREVERDVERPGFPTNGARRFCTYLERVKHLARGAPYSRQTIWFHLCKGK